MNKNVKYYGVFRPVNGIWMDANGTVLADFLADRGMTIDDRTEFARLKDYESMEYIWYRAYGAQKITITIYQLEGC